MSKIVVTFCEGPHDVAFLTQILKATGFQTYNVAIKNYISPLNEIFEKSLNNMEFAELKIDQVSSKNIPRKILKKDDTIILLYAVGGNRQYEKSSDILHRYYTLVAQSQNEQETDAIVLAGQDLDNDYCFLFFNDADNDKKEEINKINQFLHHFFRDENFRIEDQEIKKLFNTTIGIYIFSEDEGKGTLENLLMSLMKKDNEKIFQEAEMFFDTNYDEGRKVDKINKLKSTITIAGQLQSSGVSQVVTINKSNYLTKKKIEDSCKAQEIVAFFNKV